MTVSSPFPHQLKWTSSGERGRRDAVQVNRVRIVAATIVIDWTDEADNVPRLLIGVKVPFAASSSTRTFVCELTRTLSLLSNSMFSSPVSGMNKPRPTELPCLGLAVCHRAGAAASE